MWLSYWNLDYFYIFSIHYTELCDNQSLRTMTHKLNRVNTMVALLLKNVNIISQDNMNSVKNCTAVQQNQLGLYEIN